MITVPFSFIKKAGISWLYPLTTGGVTDLVVTNGQTLVLAPGGTYAYNSIDVQAGGRLVVDQTTSGAWTIIAAKSSFIVNGTIECNRGEFYTTTSASTTTPDGKNLNASITQAAGGDGRVGNAQTDFGYNGGGAGLAAFGNGGGGGQGGYSTTFPGQGAASNAGGHGGYFGSNPASGGFRPTITGTATVTAGGNGQSGTRSGEGGGGGAGGEHGGWLYLAAGVQITGSGTINLSGTNGGIGGNGVAANHSGSPSTWIGNGGGGGGGAGGSGGHLRYRAATGIAGTVTINVAAGNGGIGGSAGNQPTTFAGSGANGVAGTSSGV